MSKITVKQLMDLHGIEYDEWFEVNSSIYRISKCETISYQTSSGMPSCMSWDTNNIIDLLLADIKKSKPWIPKDRDDVYLVDVYRHPNPITIRFCKDDANHLDALDMGLMFSDGEMAKVRYNEVAEWLKRTKKVEME